MKKIHDSRELFCTYSSTQNKKKFRQRIRLILNKSPVSILSLSNISQTLLLSQYGLLANQDIVRSSFISYSFIYDPNMGTVHGLTIIRLAHLAALSLAVIEIYQIPMRQEQRTNKRFRKKIIALHSPTYSRFSED